MTISSSAALSRHDVIVVGARVAGAATAMLLARSGLDVLLVDRGRYGTDILSTLALMRSGVMQLHRWGLLDAVRDAGTPPVRRTRFLYCETTLAVDIQPAFGVDALFAPRRTVLDRILVDAARAAGVDVRFGISVDALERNPSGRVTGIVGRDQERSPLAASARIVIGADGARSQVARQVDAPVTRAAESAGGTIYGFFRGVDVGEYEWWYAPGVAAGIIPTNDRAACVFVASTAKRFHRELKTDLATGFRRVLGEVGAELSRRVAAGERTEPLHGFPGLAGYFRKPWGPGWALVGDAGYFKDPITAHGISDALRDAELVARATARAIRQPELEAEHLAEYERLRNESSEDLFEITHRIATYDWTLPEVQELHRLLSRSMKAENELLSKLGDAPAAA